MGQCASSWVWKSHSLLSPTYMTVLSTEISRLSPLFQCEQGHVSAWTAAMGSSAQTQGPWKRRGITQAIKLGGKNSKFLNSKSPGWKKKTLFKNTGKYFFRYIFFFSLFFHFSLLFSSLCSFLFFLICSVCLTLSNFIS